MSSFIQTFANAIVLGSAIYHLPMGMACLIGLEHIMKATKFLYSLKISVSQDPTFQYYIKPLGAFALWTGCVCALTYLHRDSEISAWIQIFLAGLFLLRAFFRWHYRDLFFQAFKVPWSRSRWNVLFNAFLSLVLLLAAGVKLWF